MKDFIVLGSGCKKCVQTAKLIEDAAEQRSVEVTVRKETDVQKIMTFNVMKTPAVVLDGNVVHSGSVPSTEQIELWLR